MVGRKPKPTALHIVEGTTNVTRHRNRQEEPKPAGRPVKPKYLEGRAAELWEEYFPIAYWLTSVDAHAFALWCGLAAEMERGLDYFNSGRIAQWRAISSELGFNCASRSKINTGKSSEKESDKDKFYA